MKAPPVRLGVLTPSSNTVLEPVTAARLATTPGASAHFSRFRVTEISLGSHSRAQFGLDTVLAAADLLSDARVDAMLWSGTSASWLGIEHDQRLVKAIQERTGVPATTAVLAIDRQLQQHGVSRIGLVTPYTTDVQGQIVERWATRGIEVVAERHLGLTENAAFADVAELVIEEQVRAVAASGAQAVVILCTNLNGAQVAESLEHELGTRILDSTVVAADAGLALSSGTPW